MRRLRVLAVALAGLVVALGLFGLLSPVTRVAAANSFTVNETADEDLLVASSPLCITPTANCSLRAAVHASNNSGGTNVITLPAGTYTLSSALGELQVGPSGGMSVTINGAGAASTVINTAEPGSCTASSPSTCFRLFNVDPNVNGGVGFGVSGVTLSGGRNGDIGGAGIINGTGTPAQTVDTTTLSNCVMSNNVNYGGTPGGGVVQTYGTLGITNCTFSNNASDLVGGAVDMEAPGGGGTPTLSITGSTFTGNSAPIGGGVSIANTVSGTISTSTFVSNIATGNGGGAVAVNSGSMSLANDTLTGNQAQGTANGGAVYTGGGSTTIQYSRIYNNTAGLGHTAQVFNNSAGATTAAENNWWGVNSGPGSGISNFTVTSWQVLTSTASPNPVLINQASTITASLDNTNLGGSIAPGHHVPDGDAVGFANGTLGTVSPTSAVLTGGSASTTYTAGGTGGVDGGVPTTIDAQTVKAAITVDQPPSITSGDHATFVVGVFTVLTVTTIGFPVPSLSESGALPSGVTFVDNGNGTANLSGTAAPGTAGVYPFTIKATNGVPPDATQAFTLTIDTVHPTIATTATPNSGPTGSTLQDSATLSGTGNLSGGSITFNLYAPGDPSCTTAVHTETVTGISANGPFSTSTGYVGNAAGLYEWTATFSGDGTNSSASSGCGAEPVQLTAQAGISTTANPSSGPTGSTLQDSATLTNTSNLDGTGSITFSLFGPGDNTCTSAIHTETVNGISSSGPFATTTGFVAGTAGTYQWVAVFTGDSHNTAASSACGAEPVMLTVPSTTFQDTDPNLTFDTWKGVTDGSANGGTYRTSPTAGATATFNFTGHGVTWITRKAPDQGIASVSVDGHPQPAIDLYAATAQGFSKSYTGLASGNHSIVITVTGTKNNASTNSNVAIDAFVLAGVAIQDSSYKVTYDRWAGASLAAASGGTYRITAKAGSSATLGFTGTRVDWVTATGPGTGMANVTIDGVSQGTVDLYRPGLMRQATFSYSGLTSGNHTIVVTVLSTRNPSSVGTWVVMDAFIVY